MTELKGYLTSERGGRQSNPYPTWKFVTTIGSNPPFEEVRLVARRRASYRVEEHSVARGSQRRPRKF